jgi:hypothetical protein
MLRITIYSMLMVILTMGAAIAQNDLQDIRGGQNSVRTKEEKINDRDIDRAYKSTIKRTFPDAEQKKSDPWGNVRPPPASAAKQKQ